MNNWWIATLEKLGLLTYEQAEHISDRVKNSIHKDNYADAIKELEFILEEKNLKDVSIVKKLELEIEDLKYKVKDLESRPEVKDVSEDLQKLTEKVAAINTPKPAK